MDNTWNGFRCLEFSFEEQDASIVFPSCEANGYIAIKTEYRNAFPGVEIRLLEKGFHLIFVKNKTRFATKEDCDIKAHFVKFVAEKYGLKEKCVPIGMSCGGAHAVRFAGLYPELISCMYIDAPVLNYCDFPGDLALNRFSKIWENEFQKAYPKTQRYELLQFPHHPINSAKILLENKIPIVMVYGTEDKTVSYEQNGKLLAEVYEGSALLKVIRVLYRGHHPHGTLGDNSEIVDFLIKNCK